MGHWRRFLQALDARRGKKWKNFWQALKSSKSYWIKKIIKGNIILKMSFHWIQSRLLSLFLSFREDHATKHWIKAATWSQFRQVSVRNFLFFHVLLSQGKRNQMMMPAPATLKLLKNGRFSRKWKLQACMLFLRPWTAYRLPAWQNSSQSRRTWQRAR